MTSRGDCVVAVRAACGLRELPSHIKGALSKDDARAMLTIRVRDDNFRIEGRGARGLTFDHAQEIVVRKSGFVSGRTVMVNADKAAKDMPRGLIRLLQNPDERVTIEIRAI